MFYREIFSYLDKVDSTCDKALIDAKGNGLAERNNIELEFALEPDVIEDVPKWDSNARCHYCSPDVTFCRRRSSLIENVESFMRKDSRSMPNESRIDKALFFASLSPDDDNDDCII